MASLHGSAKPSWCRGPLLSTRSSRTASLARSRAVSPLASVVPPTPHTYWAPRPGHRQLGGPVRSLLHACRRLQAGGEQPTCGRLRARALGRRRGPRSLPATDSSGIEPLEWPGAPPPPRPGGRGLPVFGAFLAQRRRPANPPAHPPLCAPAFPLQILAPLAPQKQHHGPPRLPGGCCWDRARPGGAGATLRGTERSTSPTARTHPPVAMPCPPPRRCWCGCYPACSLPALWRLR